MCRSLYCLCVYMCTELLPPGGYTIAVKYIIYIIQTYPNNGGKRLSQNTSNRPQKYMMPKHGIPQSYTSQIFYTCTNERVIGAVL
jgi:hypothetical protein